MKKIINLVIIISFFAITGCSLGKTKMEKYQEIIEDYAKDYYQSYQKNINHVTTFEITINMLNDANNKDKKYDLGKLKKCKDESKVILDINSETREVKDINFELECIK